MAIFHFYDIFNNGIPRLSGKIQTASKKINSGDEHVYPIYTPGQQNINNANKYHFYLYNISGGDVDLKIYEEPNRFFEPDQEFNIFQPLIDDLGEQSINGGSQVEVITYSVLSDPSLIVVDHFSGSQVEYKVSMVAVQDDNLVLSRSNNPATYIFDGAFEKRSTRTVQFNFTQTGFVNIKFIDDGSPSDVSVRVYEDSNNNNIFDPEDIIVNNTTILDNSGKSFQIQVNNPGAYFLQTENLNDYAIGETSTNRLRYETSYLPTQTDTSPLTLEFGTAQIAYVAYYGRPADPDGVTFWNNALQQISYSPRNGDLLTGNEAQAYDRVVNDFGNSAEANRIFGALSNRDKVNTVYNFAFGRDGDDGGLNYWSEQLDRGSVNLTSFALEVALGAQNQDIMALRNKIESADLFSQGINAFSERNAYRGAKAEIFGRNWLEDFNKFSATDDLVNSALTDLVNS